jgi:hypothetical protein
MPVPVNSWPTGAMDEDGGVGGCGGGCGVDSEEKQRHTMLRHIKFSICGNVRPRALHFLIHISAPARASTKIK